MHQIEIVGGGAQQMAIVRYHHQRAFEVDERFGQRLAHIEIEVVSGFVEQQHVRALPDDQRQHQPRLFAAGEARRNFADFVSLEAEAAKIVAQLLLQHLRRNARQVLQRRLVAAQILQLMLREVAELNAFRQPDLAVERGQLARQQLNQR